jgi:hypothetical protein
MVEVMVVALFAAAAGGIILGALRRQTGIRERVWHEVALGCGLERIRYIHGFNGQYGEARSPDELLIELHELAREGAGGTRVTVRPMADITLRSETPWTSLGTRIGAATDVETGSRTFDGAVYASGAPALVLALFDAETREAVDRLLRGSRGGGRTRYVVSAKVDGGQLQVDLGLKATLDMAHLLKESLEVILGIARRLTVPDDVPARLAHNARHDPEVAVRLTNLRHLARTYEEESLTRETLRAACADGDDAVRLEAGRALRGEGDAVLRDLAARAEADETAAAAVEALAARLSEQDALALLAAALPRRRFATAGACVKVLARVGSATAERPLLDLLAHADEALRFASVNALGFVGTRSAVLPLQEIAEKVGGEMRREARQAVAEIQSRLSGADHGQLTVASVDSGQVSLPSAVDGQVSLDGQKTE